MKAATAILFSLLLAWTQCLAGPSPFAGSNDSPEDCCAPCQCGTVCCGSEAPSSPPLLPLTSARLQFVPAAPIELSHSATVPPSAPVSFSPPDSLSRAEPIYIWLCSHLL